MKKLLFVLLLVGLVSGTQAQRGKRIGGGGGYYRSNLGVSYNPFYPYYGYTPLWNAYPYNNYGYGVRPTKLEVAIADINNDYKDKIWSARQDPNLKGKERREKIRSLKNERDKTLEDLKRNYYKRS
jgi:hypothetical protein